MDREIVIESAKYNASWDVKYAKERLVSQAKYIAEKMNLLVKRVEEGSSVNSLGELQSSGPELDRLCAEFVLAQKHEQAVLRLLDNLENAS